MRAMVERFSLVLEDEQLLLPTEPPKCFPIRFFAVFLPVFQSVR